MLELRQPKSAQNCLFSVEAYLDDGVRGFLAHVVDGILVTQPIRAFDLEEMISGDYYGRGFHVQYRTYATSSHLQSCSAVRSEKRLTLLKSSNTYTECSVDTTLLKRQQRYS